MTEASALSYLRDQRLAASAASLEPAWVWSIDGTRVLWANAVAVALLGAPNLAQLRERRFAPTDKPAAHIVRLAASLPANGAARLERMRGFGTGFFRLLTCTCSRLLGHGTPAILVISTERAGPVLPLADRARRLFEGCEDAVAAFNVDGTLLYATPSAAHRMAGATTLLAFDANAIAAEALHSGASAGRTLAGPTSFLRAGQNHETMLIASFAAPVEASIAPEPEPELTAIEAFRAEQAAQAGANAGTSKESSASSSPLAAVDAPSMTAAEPQPAAPEPATETETAEQEPAPAETPSEQPRIVRETLDAPLAPEQPSTPGNDAPAAIKDQPVPETAAPVAAALPVHMPTADEAPRQHPLRFVWQMDADEHFTLTSDEFLHITGAGTARVIGKRWDEINGALQLDGEGRVARAITTRDTWSGVVLSWPVDGTDRRLKVELSGLPIYDRQRTFVGYRGFGVCRDLDALTEIAALRRAAPAVVAPAPVAPEPADAPLAANDTRNAAAELPATAAETADAPARPTSRPNDYQRQVITFIGPSQNVVPFRVTTPPEPGRAPGLNAGERHTFTEIARQLSARLKNHNEPQEAEEAPAAPPPPPIIETRAPALEPPAPVAATSASVAERVFEASRDIAQATTRPTAAPTPAATPDEGAWVAHTSAAAKVPQPSPGADAGARLFLDGLPLGVLIYRFDTMLYANRPFLAFAGYSTLHEFSDAGGIDSLFIEASGTETGPAGTQTLTITTSNGEKVPVEGRLFQVPWDDDNAMALMLVGPRTQHEPVQQPATPVHDDSELRARLKAVEEQLAEAQRTAAAIGSDRSDLLGRIGKEARAPLAAIIGYVESMLNERYGPIGNERYRTFLTDIHYSGSRIIALFDDLASFSKIDRTGKSSTNNPAISLNDIVQNCVTQMQADASRMRVLIRTSFANPLSGIAAEQDSVRQVVLNLLTNSIRFAGAGGQVIVSSTVNADGKVVLRLRDTGPGLSDSELARLQSSGQGSPTADAADQQLSLAVARALLEANGATLSVTSKPDEGTLVEAIFVAAHA